MEMIRLDDESYNYLIQIISEKYYQTTDIDELKKINQLYKKLKFKSETWLSK
ncbi:hypothetical protein [Enterocloster clostridioformis]|uniref:PLAT domain-containing protein n=1 Tax=Enterocloster clostridioformis TaxID=1531 RepID=A0A1I0K661_9FIRM|nr:hypothetical protein [Enterocloster clostridioformis]SEU19034.1 hypothetical protein SAMN05216521_10935 [Enterocloster clostridioformis]SEW49021.1 hypothetical protein SAMN05216528_10895 [Enterocloster clostridioformis]